MTICAGKRSTMSAPITAKPANKYSALFGLPVRSVSQPTNAVLAIPAILPSEFTSAIPAAAAAPVRNIGGKLQKQAWVVDAPAAARFKPNMAAPNPKPGVPLSARPVSYTHLTLPTKRIV